MATLKVIDLTGADLEAIEVADSVFAAEIKEHLLWEVVRFQRAKRRAGTASTQTRAEVSATKAKMFRQKGTGNARHGSRRANVFRGGGQVHGPKPRSYEFHVNKKVMRGALRAALSLRAQAGDLLVVRDIAIEDGKTRNLAAALARISASKALVVDAGDNVLLQRSARNLADAIFLDERGLNVYDILRFPKLVISERSLRSVESRLNGAAA